MTEDKPRRLKTSVGIDTKEALIKFKFFHSYFLNNSQFHSWRKRHDFSRFSYLFCLKSGQLPDLRRTDPRSARISWEALIKFKFFHSYFLNNSQFHSWRKRHDFSRFSYLFCLKSGQLPDLRRTDPRSARISCR
jgi:hypothetical protein